DRAQRLGIGRLRLALALEHLAGEEGQHDRREDAHQLPGLVVAQAGGLAEAGLRARQLATEHVAEDAGAVGLPRLGPAAPAAPPSTAPSRPPRSPAPEKSFCSAPNSASAPCGWLALRPSAPSSRGSAAPTAVAVWSCPAPSCCAICCSGAPWSCWNSCSVREL